MNSAPAVNDELAIVIPTRNRPDDLRNCLQSLVDQTMTPGLVVIADASDNGLSADVAGEYGSSIRKIEHIACAVAGVTAQRNEGLLHIRPETKYVGFADDDVVFDARYFSRIVALLDHAPDVVGASGVSTEPIHQIRRLDAMLLRLFLLGAASESGQVLPSGVNVRPPRHGPATEVGWLFGCAVYRSALFDSNRFSEELLGYGAYEDVDFSLSAKRRGRLVVDPQATLQHRHSTENRIGLRELHATSIAHRYRLVMSHRDQGLRPAAYWWSVCGAAGFALASLLHHPSEEAKAVFMGVCSGAVGAMGQAVLGLGNQGKS